MFSSNKEGEREREAVRARQCQLEKGQGATREAVQAALGAG